MYMYMHMYIAMVTMTVGVLRAYYNSTIGSRNRKIGTKGLTNINMHRNIFVGNEIIGAAVARTMKTKVSLKYICKGIYFLGNETIEAAATRTMK